MQSAFRLRTCVIVLLVVLTACSPAATPLSPMSPTELPPPTVVPATATPVLTPTPVSTSTPAPTVTRTAQDLGTELDTIMQKVTKAGLFSGSVLAARAGQIVLSQGYDLADRDKKIPNTAQTRYRIYSITKQFTAMAILMLQEQGKLNVQNPICNYISNCPAAWKEITIHHLLTHTSGIPSFESRADYDATQSTLTLLDQTTLRFKDKPLSFQPGEKWSYNNFGYILLGKIIEQASGQSYEDFLQKNIFEPLQMMNTGYGHSQTDMAVGYVNQSKADDMDTLQADGAGGLYSTVEDLYRWDQALYTEQLVPQKVLDAMFAAHASIGDGFSYGYGWFIGKYYNRRSLYHTGGSPRSGYISRIVRYPDDKVTVIVLANEESHDPATISEMFEKKIFGEQ